MQFLVWTLPVKKEVPKSPQAFRNLKIKIKLPLK